MLDAALAWDDAEFTPAFVETLDPGFPRGRGEKRGACVLRFNFEVEIELHSQVWRRIHIWYIIYKYTLYDICIYLTFQIWIKFIYFYTTLNICYWLWRKDIQTLLIMRNAKVLPDMIHVDLFEGNSFLLPWCDCPDRGNKFVICYVSIYTVFSDLWASLWEVWADFVYVWGVRWVFLYLKCLVGWWSWWWLLLLLCWCIASYVSALLEPEDTPLFVGPKRWVDPWIGIWGSVLYFISFQLVCGVAPLAWRRFKGRLVKVGSSLPFSQIMEKCGCILLHVGCSSLHTHTIMEWGWLVTFFFFRLIWGWGFFMLFSQCPDWISSYLIYHWGVEDYFPIFAGLS